MPIERVEFLGIGFDLLGMDAMLRRMGEVTADSPYGYVVTPNVDHVVRLNERAADHSLRPLYDGAAYSLCDSRILQHLARIHGLQLPLIAGSDLTAQLFRHVVRPGDRIAIVGGDAEMMASLQSRHPGVTFLHHEPPMGLRHDASARAEAARIAAEAGARFIFIAVGSPQQEMIAAEIGRLPAARGMALCIGASLDFIAGRERRAPEALRALSLEWAYRLLANPRRMWRRYLVEGPRVFVLAARYRRNAAQ